MLSDIFDLIDDFLIDRCFQPVCGRIRLLFGWSKRVPVIFMKALTIIGFIPFLGVLMTFGGMFYIIALVIIALILINVFRIKKLIHEEISNSRRERAHASQALDGCRIWEKNERRDTFFLSCFMIPFILATTLIPEYRFVASFYLVGCYANLCDPFFRACSDLPKGKTMFQRFREWLRIPSESTATQ